MASGTWVVHDEINVIAEQNQAAVRAELVFANVVFGLHRLYAGGSAPLRLALASPEEWDAASRRGGQGDNLILVSLRKVNHLALAHVGSPTSAVPPVPTDAVQARFLAFLGDESNELAVVHRHMAATSTSSAATTPCGARRLRTGRMHSTAGPGSTVSSSSSMTAK